MNDSLAREVAGDERVQRHRRLALRMAHDAQRAADDDEEPVVRRALAHQQFAVGEVHSSDLARQRAALLVRELGREARRAQCLVAILL